MHLQVLSQNKANSIKYGFDALVVAGNVHSGLDMLIPSVFTERYLDYEERQGYELHVLRKINEEQHIFRADHSMKTAVLNNYMVLIRDYVECFIFDPRNLKVERIQSLP